MNTVLAPADVRFVLFEGVRASGDSATKRAGWISAHTAQWQVGWSFWFVVTLTFLGSFFVLARWLHGPAELRALAVGAALVAAAVDIVGIVVQLVLVPGLADANGPPATSFLVAQHLGDALTGVAAFGLYTGAGLLLLPAAFATAGFPRLLAWLGAAEWGISALATLFLAIGLPGHTFLLGAAFALYAPWVWGSAWWLARDRSYVQIRSSR